MRRRDVVTGIGGVAGTVGLAGCMTLNREPTDEQPPTVNAIRFVNHDDQAHEVQVRFEAESETLFSHTESLSAKTGSEPPSTSIHPDVPKANWRMHASLAGSSRERSIWQARIEYPKIDILCRVTPDGRLDLRVNNAAD